METISDGVTNISTHV